MLINIIFFILSISTTGVIYYFTGMYQYWYLYFLLPPILIVSYFAILFVYMLILFLLALILKSIKAETKPRKFYYGIIKETTYALLILARVKVKRSNMNLAPKEKSLIISNHQSNFDPMIVFSSFKTSPISCVTKPQNLDIPIAGGWVKYAGFIPINRESNFEAVKAINLASSFIKNDKASICIYPEGKRNFDGGLLDFHAGSFKIAVKAKAPIVICSTYNTKTIKNNFPWHKTIVEFKILKVLYPEEYEGMTTSEIADLAKKLIGDEIYAKENAN